MQDSPPRNAPLAHLESLLAGGTGLTPLDRLIGRRLGLQCFCTLLRALPVAGCNLTRRLAPVLAPYLSTDYSALMAEEEEGLLPHLERRLLVGDDLDAVVNQLSDEHRQDREQARQLAIRCLDFANGTDDDWLGLCDILAQFAERQRRHLTWEDATILPMARDRLSAEDQTQWEAEMDQRYRLVMRRSPT